MKNEIYGAPAERGEIVEIENGRYIVAGIDRDGIRSLPIRAIGNEEIGIGDRVYFFLFPDGDGLIIGKL